MKRLLLIGISLCIALCTSLINCSLHNSDAIAIVKTIVSENINEFEQFIKDSLISVVEARERKKELQNHFLRARILYKKMEWATEYFMPTTTQFVNGPPVPEIEIEENRIFEPEGLQVVENLIYAEDSIDYSELLRQCKLLQSYAKTYASYWNALELNSSQVFDAVKLQVFRIVSLGISGFDAPLAKSSIHEAAISLDALNKVMSTYSQDESFKKLFRSAIRFADACVIFENFDRLAFIKDYCNPLTEALVTLQKRLDIPFVQDRRLLKPDAVHLFAAGAFDVNAYTTDSSYFSSEHKVSFGRRLFYDPILSKDNKRSCASCHDPKRAFTDGKPSSSAFQSGFVKRNAPTLLNAALQPWQFYDMRTTSLENQSIDVIQNVDEMHGDLTYATHKISNDTIYQRLFEYAFNKRQIQPIHLQNAIASYIRSLVYMNSRFDKFMQNRNGITLSTIEKQGFNLFMGKAKCGTCHFAPLFNGTVPPSFMNMESEVIGVPISKNVKEIDDDLGRYNQVKVEPYRHSFKTTTVRNVSLTGPYMHNGIFETLEEVVDFYDKGGGIGIGINIKNQTLPPDHLKLDDQEKKALLAFLHALEDDTD